MLCCLRVSFLSKERLLHDCMSFHLTSTLGKIISLESGFVCNIIDCSMAPVSCLISDSGSGECDIIKTEKNTLKYNQDQLKYHCE